MVRLWELPESVWPEQAVLERLAQVSKSIEAGPADAKLLTQRGRLYVRLGRFDEAARDFIRSNEVLASPWGWDATSRVFQSLMERDEVFTRIAELRPDDTALWIACGQYHALRSQWERAVGDFARVVDTRAFPYDWPQYALLLLLTGADDEYRRLCAQMVERWGQTDNADTTLQLAFTCSLSGHSGVDPQQILRWARIADNHTRNKFSLRALSMANYRAGQAEQAVTLMHEVINQPDAGIGAATAFPLALFHHALGQKEEARRWYGLGVNELLNATPRDADVPAGWAVSHWMGANLLHRQAKALFGPTEGKPGESAEDTPRQAPEAKKTEPPQKEGQKQETKSGDETRAAQRSDGTPQPLQTAAGKQPEP